MLPPGNPLGKTFNRHTVKLSYSCMPNMGRLISKTNKPKLKTDDTVAQPKTCNCNGRQCPVGGNCLESEVIYQAEVKRAISGEVSTYIGLTQDTFKKRHNQHMSDFRLLQYRNKTRLSSHIWDLKEKGVNFDLSWRIVAKAKAYSPGSRSCNLCNSEKFFILFRPQLASLNSRNELMSKCKHKDKFKLSVIKK